MWDDELDQCVGCTRTQNRTQKIQDYFDTFEVGDLVVWNGKDHLLACKRVDKWDMVDPTTLHTRSFFTQLELFFGSGVDIRELIYKRT